MIELGWSDIRLAICEEAFDASAWDLVSFDPKGGQSVMEIAAIVLRKIEGIAA